MQEPTPPVANKLRTSVADMQLFPSIPYWNLVVYVFFALAAVWTLVRVAGHAWYKAKAAYTFSLLEFQVNKKLQEDIDSNEGKGN